MRGRNHDDNGAVPQFDPPDPVNERDPTEIRPSGAGLVDDPAHSADRLGCVRLVIEELHAGTDVRALDRMVPDRSRKDHHSTAIRSHRPVVEVPDRKALGFDGNPIILGQVPVDEILAGLGLLHDTAIHTTSVSVHGCRAVETKGRPATFSAVNFTTVGLVSGHFDEVDGFGSDEPPRRSGADSPAPLPPHERVWRHPSEIGFASVTAIDSRPINIGRNGRTLIGVVTVAGVVLCVALVLALQPDSLRSDPHDVVALANSRLRVASFDYQHPNPDRLPTPSAVEPMTPVESPRVAIGSRLVDRFRFASGAVSSVTRPSQSPQTSMTTTIPVAASARAMGILSESGEHLLTTMAAVNEIDSIDVRLPNGQMVRSRILHTLPDLHIAVLSVSDESTTGSRADVKASGLGTNGFEYALGQPVMVLIESPLEFVIGQPLDDVIVSLDTYAAFDLDASKVAEGAPLVSKAGHLIGLCTHAAGRLGFIPVNLVEAALADLLNEDAVDATTTSLMQ